MGLPVVSLYRDDKGHLRRCEVDGREIQVERVRVDDEARGLPRVMLTFPAAIQHLMFEEPAHDSLGTVPAVTDAATDREDAPPIIFVTIRVEGSQQYRMGLTREMFDNPDTLVAIMRNGLLRAEEMP